MEPSPPTAVGRKRARPVTRAVDAPLRERVLALIHSTRGPLAAQRRALERAYDAAWRAFCRAISVDDNDPDHASSHAALATALRELSREAQGVDMASELLAAKVASSVAAARGHVDRRQRLVLAWTWLGHGRLWRLEDVLRAVQALCGGSTSEGSSASTGVRGAVRSLVAEEPSAASEERVLRRLAALDQSGSMAAAVVAYLVRIVFSYSAIDASGNTHRGDQTEGFGALALDALESICRGNDGGPGGAAVQQLALVCRVVSSRIQQQQQQQHKQQHASDAAAAAVVASQRAFLRAQVKAALIDLLCSPPPTQGADEVAFDEILATLQSAVSAADVVQLFRQVWLDAASTGSPAVRDPIERLAPLLAACAQRDPALRAHALATAHDLAQDAITASDAVLLRHSLELAGAATVGVPNEDGDAEDAGYAAWFRSHFAAIDAPSALSARSTTSDSSDNKRLSLSGKEASASASHACLRAPPPTPSSGATASCSSMCSLVSTKRHLQFVCAFLAEFDRAESTRRRAYHVLAHLSAIKTHQTLGGSAVGGLLSDFFSQTRARYADLNAREKEASARSRRRRLSSLSSVRTSISVLTTPSQATPAGSQYAPGTRGLVEELLELHGRDQAALASRVNQLKMFSAPQWKQEILPCCLDLKYWQGAGLHTSSAPDEDEDPQLTAQRRKQVSAIVSLVQVMAKHHAVGTNEYTAFLDRVEAWVMSSKLHHETAGDQHNSHPGGDQQLIRLIDAATEYFDTQLRAPAELDSPWAMVTSTFVDAFEGLVFERAVEQVEQMERIYETTVGRLAHAAAVRSLSFDQAVEMYLALWIALLSNETANDGTPQDRMEVMEAYCKLASQRAVRELVSDTSHVAADERLVETALLGSLLGLLASVTITEALARAVSLAFCAQLEPTTAEPDVDDLVTHLKRASAFLSGFLVGFTKNPGENAPQILLQSMLTQQMRECLVWVGQHTSTWWNNDFAHGMTPAPDDSVSPGDMFWPFVQRSIQSIHEQHGWFRLTFSPGVFVTKDQWQVFVAMELTCCVTQLLDGGGDQTKRHVDVIDFIHREHEQFHGLMLASAAGQSAGVRVVDVCMWVTQTTLELSASSPRVSPFALDALVLLLKDVWTVSVREHTSNEPPSPSDVLGFLMELTLQLLERAQRHRRELVHYAVRCASVVVDGTSAVPTFVNIPSQVVRNFVEQVALGVATAVVPFEWVSVTWCIVLKLQHTAEVYPSATDIPVSIFAHWAFEFPRLCRLLTVRKNGKVSHASNAALLRTVQTCYEFFRTLDVRRLASAPSMTLFGVSASQYVPASTADETLELHVRALEWLIASERLPVPDVGRDLTIVSPLRFETSLACQQVAGRVLAALLEDLSIGRPEDVANQLTEICQSAWLASIASESTRPSAVSSPADFQFQILLTYMVADLAARHASVGRFLLRSSSELLSDLRQSLFLLLVLIASKELEQIDRTLKLNGSLWLNTFAEVACALVDVQATEDQESSPVVSLVRHSTGFQDQLTAVLSRLLGFAAAKQIDLLDTAVIARMEHLFPTLRELLARVPVLNLASAALADW